MAQLRAIRMSHGPTHCIRALVLLLLLLPAGSASANLFSSGDYERFHDLLTTTNALGDEIAALLDKSPPPALQDCLIRLNGNLDAFHAELRAVATLVGVSSKMVDPNDERIVFLFLDNQAKGFLKTLQFKRRLANLTEDKCSQDGTVTAKVQATLRIYDGAAALVESIIKTISPSLPR
jgi:hypothetical protein